MTAVQKLVAEFNNLSKEVTDNFSKFLTSSDNKEKKKLAEKHQELFQKFRGTKGLENPSLEDQAAVTEARTNCLSALQEAYKDIGNFRFYEVEETQELPAEDKIKVARARALINKIDGSQESEKAARDAIGSIGHRAGKLGEAGERVVSPYHPEILALRKEYNVKTIEEQQKVVMNIINNEKRELREINRATELCKRIPEKIMKLGNDVNPELVKMQDTLTKALEGLNNKH